MASFFENYREALKSPSIRVVSKGENGAKTAKSNDLVFRNANEGEKTGLQKVTFLDNDYGKHDVYLVVPERESVGYGNIRGWGDNKEDMLYSRKAMESGSPFISGLLPFTAALDLTIGNVARNNATKNTNSKYTGEDKAVGVGKEGQSEGTILGFIDEDGIEHNAEQAKKLFNNPMEDYGYIGIESYEKPTMVQEHTGPAYVPGDILLGLLGLQPNRGAVGFTFKEPQKHSDYRGFITQLRNAWRRDK